MDLRLANHWRRILVSSRSRRSCRAGSRGCSSDRERPGRFSSSSRPGVVAVGKPMMVRTRRCASPKARLQPAGQRLIGEQRVEVASASRARGRDAGWSRRWNGEIGQRLAVIEPAAFGHEAVEQRQHAVGAVDEAAQQFHGIDAGFSRPS